MTIISGWVPASVSPEEARRDAQATRARVELQDLANLRFVAANEARKVGDPDRLTQRDIHEVLGVSQPEVSRILRRVRVAPDLLERTPREVVLLRTIGKIGTEEMLRILTEWPYTFGSHEDVDNPLSEAYVPGDFDQIGESVRGGLLSEAEYNQIRSAAGAREADAATVVG
ncbi:hypothetical protein D1871_14955 [Nakamurella silvestris]|nr:hypothetical protein D1871_14955 [Nakamurella silvestris]